MDFYKVKHSNKKNHYSNADILSRSRKNEPTHSYRNSRDDRFSHDRYNNAYRKPESHIVKCNNCGNECQIPFMPKFDRPIYCSKCFKKNIKQADDAPYSRDIETSRNKYLYEKKNPGYTKANISNYKSKTERFLKKRESFYSNGSEKFYSSLKEKLFEILGGKKCSNCGFNDERVLGFNHIDNPEIFDSIRRGGIASSWGKYVSEPELARRDLRVLCLNCNEIKKPLFKPKDKKPVSYKPSRYFPR